MPIMCPFKGTGIHQWPNQNLKKKKLTAFWEPTSQWGMHNEKLSSKLLLKDKKYYGENKTKKRK